MSDTRKTAHVKWFADKKGYGFIVDELLGDVMVHHSDINMEGYRRLRPGQVVSYSVKETENGYKAKDIMPKNEFI